MIDNYRHTEIFILGATSYQKRRAVKGSSGEERSAGKKVGRGGRAKGVRTAITRVRGSRGFKPNNRDLAACAAASAKPVPITKPVTVSTVASRRIILRTSKRSAPIAMRIPISLVRWITM